MKEEIKNMLEEYIKANVSPILTTVDKNVFKDYTEIKADCTDEFLKGSFDENNYQKPSWYIDIINKQENNINLLLITDLDKVSKEKQKRFIELLKYRQINILTLPKNCVIIVLVDKISKETIDKDIYSLSACIN